jgi:hypothetical protein
MKLSKNTLSIIKNFSQINQNLLIKPGNTISTISPSKWIYGEAQVEEDFPVEFPIYDLSELLSVISIFNDPELVFEDSVLYITEGKNKVRYMPSEPNILIVPKSSPKFPANSDVSFELSASTLQQITRAAAVLKVPFVSIIGDGKSVSIIVTDKNNPNSNHLEIQVGDTEYEFSVNLKVELFKMIPESYELHMSSEKRACKLIGTDKMYLLAWETDSTFTK